MEKDTRLVNTQVGSQTTLASLALLKVISDQRGHDHIDYIAHLAGESVTQRQNEKIDKTILQQWLSTDLGLNVPLHTCELILKRLRKKEIIKEESGVLFVGHKVQYDSNLAKIKNEVTMLQKRIVEHFQAYVKKNFNIELSVNDAFDSLIVYLREFSLEGLSSTSRGTALPEINTDDEYKFMVNSFIAYESIREGGVIDDLVTLFKGNMLANAFTCENLQYAQKKFNDVNFYLDTPLLLALMGFSSDEKKRATEELVSLLQALQGTICVFMHTIEETCNVLITCASHFDDPHYYNNPAIRYTYNRNGTPSDLELAAASIDDWLKIKNIQRKVSPDPNKFREFVISESSLEKILRERVKQERETTLQYDIKSVRSIFILRGKHEPRSLEDAKHVLITSNSSLAKAVYEFGKDYGSIQCVSAVVSDYSVANIAWLKSPTNSTLPRAELIASCTAAIEPGDELWERVLNEAEKLRNSGEITEEHLEAFRVSSVARRELMHLTCGSEKRYSTKTLREVLETFKNQVGKEEQEKREAIQREYHKISNKLTFVDSNIDEFSKKVGTWITNLVVLLYIIIVILLYIFFPFWVGLFSTLVGVPSVFCYKIITKKITAFVKRSRIKSIYGIETE
ncbi:MAG TPA: hypothetical protein VNK96_02130 [Fimbriimonadales bacterium]|nr:hypothetical protein [Fimbriimonadales bacterium]